MEDRTFLYIIAFIVFGHIAFGIGWLVWKMNKTEKHDTEQ